MFLPLYLKRTLMSACINFIYSRHQPEGPRAGELQPVLLLVLRGAEVLALGVGDAEAELRRIFAQAHAHCSSHSSSSTLTSISSSSSSGESEGAKASPQEEVPRSAVIFFDEASRLPERVLPSLNFIIFSINYPLL